MIAKLVELNDVDVVYETNKWLSEKTHFEHLEVDLGRAWFDIDHSTGRPYVRVFGNVRIYLPRRYEGVKSMKELMNALIADGIDADYEHLPPDPDTFEYEEKED